MFSWPAQRGPCHHQGRTGSLLLQVSSSQELNNLTATMICDPALTFVKLCLPNLAFSSTFHIWTELIAQLDDLRNSYFDFCIDHLIQIQKFKHKYISHLERTQVPRQSRAGSGKRPSGGQSCSSLKWKWMEQVLTRNNSFYVHDHDHHCGNDDGMLNQPAQIERRAISWRTSVVQSKPPRTLIKVSLWSWWWWWYQLWNLSWWLGWVIGFIW